MDLLVEAELRRALEQFGCALCRVGEDAAVRYLRTVLGEGTNDGATRARLGRSWGFCTRHSWHFLSLEWHATHDSLGAATVLEGLVEAAETAISALLESSGTATTPRAWRKAVVEPFLRLLEPKEICPACRIQSDHERYAATVLLRGLDEPAWRERLATSEGFCLRHYQEVLVAAETTEVARWLVEDQRRRLREVRIELAEYGPKHDYRFSQERYGKEGDVAVRATGALAGSWFGLPRRPRPAAENREGTARG